MEVHYYFKLKYNIWNNSELDLAKLEIEKLMEKPAKEIVDFADVLSEQPLVDFFK
jgi:hypothetical protein